MSEKKQIKEDKRAAALRDNLKKRKAFVKETRDAASKAEDHGKGKDE